MSSLGLKRGPKVLLSQREKFEIRLNRESGIPIEQCAKMAGVSRSTCLKYLAELRQLFGPEKLKNERSARSYLGRPEFRGQEKQQS